MIDDPMRDWWEKHFERLERESDKDHREGIHRSAIDVLVALGMSEQCALTAVKAIARGDVPNCKISY